MEHTLTIHKLIHGGKGLATLADGMVVMVPGVLPGERVQVRETKTHRGHKEAELIRIEEASPERVTPPCPYYGRCGGCNLQHATYEAQLQIKRQILMESLQRARIELGEDQPLTTLPSPTVFAYRHRIRLHLDAEDRLGFHQALSNDVVPISRCLLATEPINRALATLADQDTAALFQGQVREIELIHSPADDRVVLVLHAKRDARPKALASLSAGLAPLADAVVLAQKKPGRGHEQAATTDLAQIFSLHDRTYQLRWPPSSFFQVNAAQNQRLVALALEATHRLTPPFSLLDLFCGMGNFSIPMVLQGAKVLGIEHNRQSIFWAKANSRANGIKDARFVAGDVAEELEKLIKGNQRMDCVLLDPPRQGLGKAATLVPQLQPRLIVSISCDPATQARDLKQFIDDGYRLIRITPVDMFPQTHHIESLALLERI